MKFLIETEVLAKSLGNVHGSIGKKNVTIPILLNVKIEARGDELSLTTTDLDMAITSKTKAKIDVEGATTAPAQLLYDIIRKIPEGSEISIELEGNSLNIKYGKSQFKLPCLSVDEFPSIEQAQSSSKLIVPQVQLMEMINKSRFAISNDETRYYLNGIYFHSKEVDGKRMLRAVATDGHRLALVEYGADEDVKSIEKGIIIPRKTIHEMYKVMEGVEDNIELSISESKIKMQAGDTVIISKIIDGDFPDYERVIPKDNNKIVKVDKKVISDAIDRVSTIADDKHRSIKIIIDNNMIKLQANTAEGGFADEEISCEYNEDRIDTGFNSRYLLDVLGQVDSDMVFIKLKDGSLPSIIQGEGEDKTLFVVMPVRT